MSRQRIGQRDGSRSLGQPLLTALKVPSGLLLDYAPFGSLPSAQVRNAVQKSYEGSASQGKFGLQLDSKLAIGRTLKAVNV